MANVKDACDEKDDEERTRKMFYIVENINESGQFVKISVLQTIMNSSTILDENITEKGTGTSILFKDINNELLSVLYNLIKTKMDSSEDMLNL